MANPPCTRDRFFLVFASTTTSDNKGDKTRLGVITSKKVSKRAVERNRIKRLVREAFRNNKPILSGLDIVVLTKQAACHTDNKKLFLSLDKHWQTLQKNAKNPD